MKGFIVTLAIVLAFGAAVVAFIPAQDANDGKAAAATSDKDVGSTNDAVLIDKEVVAACIVELAERVSAQAQAQGQDHEGVDKTAQALRDSMIDYSDELRKRGYDDDVLAGYARTGRALAARELSSPGDPGRWKDPAKVCSEPTTEPGGFVEAFASAAAQTHGVPVSVSSPESEAVPQPADQPTHVNDVATQICEAHESLMQEAINMGQQGIPISVAEHMADNALQSDPNLYAALDSSIRLAYSDPMTLSTALANGRWVDACAKIVRGR